MKKLCLIYNGKLNFLLLSKKEIGAKQPKRRLKM
jgi:hypothetical protein